MPRESTLPIYDALVESGRQHGISDYGSFAMNVLRLEKAFKGAAELTNEVDLVEADVMKFTDLSKKFIGSEATQQSLSGQHAWVCAYIEIEADGETDGHGGEAVLVGDKIVGSTTSIAYSPTVGKILAFAYVEPHTLESQEPLYVVIQNQHP